MAQFPTRTATVNADAFAHLRSTLAAAGLTFSTTISDDAMLALAVANLLESEPTTNRGNILGVRTVTSLGTNQNSTPTIAQLLTGILTQTSATGAGTVTMPLGTAIDAGIPSPVNGDTFQALFANLGGGFTLTITAGASGTTIRGTAAIPSAKNGILTFVRTGTATWDVHVTVSA